MNNTKVSLVQLSLAAILVGAADFREESFDPSKGVYKLTIDDAVRRSIAYLERVPEEVVTVDDAFVPASLLKNDWGAALEWAMGIIEKAETARLEREVVKGLGDILAEILKK
jgi:hypothetical protein